MEVRIFQVRSCVFKKKLLFVFSATYIWQHDCFYLHLHICGRKERDSCNNTDYRSPRDNRVNFETERA